MQIKENNKAPRHWPLCGEFTGDRWIPRTNGQLRGECFHLMTSSCFWEVKSHVSGIEHQPSVDTSLWLCNHCGKVRSLRLCTKWLRYYYAIWPLGRPPSRPVMPYGPENGLLSDSTKPWVESMVPYCELGLQEEIFMKFQSKYPNFHERYIWNCLCLICFVQAPMCRPYNVMPTRNTPHMIHVFCFFL